MSKADAKTRRIARIGQLLSQGLTDREIAEREGMDATNLSKFYKENGLVAKPGRKAKRAIHPHGIHSYESILFIKRLSRKLQELRDQGYEAEDVAAMTGITEKQQNLTMNIRSDAKMERHNFSIAQIERLADALGISFLELIAHCTRPA